MGRLTQYGNFIPDPNKIRQWIIPDLAEFELRPYVAKTCPPVSNAVRNVKQYIEEALINDGK